MLKSIKDISFVKKYNALFSTVLLDCSGILDIISTMSLVSSKEDNSNKDILRI